MLFFLESCAHVNDQCVSMCAEQAITVHTETEESVGPCLTQHNADCRRVTMVTPAFTDHKRKKRISEVYYLCLISTRYISCVTLLPDHAPVSEDLSFAEEKVDAKPLFHRAQDLCSHYTMKRPGKSFCQENSAVSIYQCRCVCLQACYA